MEESEKKEIEEERKTKEHNNKEIESEKKQTEEIIKNILKNRYNFYLLGVLIFALSLRLYYFFLVGNQPLWWDEAVYGSLARNFVSNSWGETSFITKEMVIRPVFLSLIWSFLLRINIPEMGSRFLLEVIPSFLSVLFVYLVGKETFGRRAGIFAAFILSVMWIHLFYTVRILTNIPSMVFLFSSFYFFIKSTNSELNYKYFSISLFLLSIATLIRYPNGMLFFVYLIVLALSKELLLNKSKFWYVSLIGLSPIIFFFIVNFVISGNIFPAVFDGSYLQQGKVGEELAPFGFFVLKYIPTYLGNIFFVFFIIGLALTLFEISVGYNLLTKSAKLRNYLLIILIMLAFYAFFVFYIRGAEDRHLLPASISLVCLAGFGMDFCYKLIKKYQKVIAIIFVLTVLILGANFQIKTANNLIETRKDSFLQMRQAFEWIKDNTPEDSLVLGNSIEPYAIYYAERNYLQLPTNESNLPGVENEADYLVVHAFTPPPDYVDTYLQENQDLWEPINVFFLDQEQTQPLLVIYRKI